MYISKTDVCVMTTYSRRSRLSDSGDLMSVGLLFCLAIIFGNKEVIFFKEVTTEMEIDYFMFTFFIWILFLALNKISTSSSSGEADRDFSIVSKFLILPTDRSLFRHPTPALWSFSVYARHNPLHIIL